MFLKNTLTKQTESFTPKTDTVRLYACGPTVYGEAHIGNLRAAVVFDTLVRTLRLQWPVVFARNITDVDDKIITAAQTHFPDLPIQDAISHVTTPAIAAWHESGDRLGNARPDFEPKATDYIPQMVDMIATLVKKGFAYAKDGHVFFNTTNMPTHLHGILSGRTLMPAEDAQTFSRLDTIARTHPADFVLWKPSDASLPGWDSPWGRGRPGWHIECSAMSKDLFGNQFDIHAGGQDLIFPHHENEIAQSACACDHHQIQADTWVHVGMLTVNGTKMSKSLGNVVTLNTLALPGSVLRLALLSSHYRSTLDWTPTLLEQAMKRWTRFATITPDDAPMPASVRDLLENDLNTPGALSEIDRLIDSNTPGAWASINALGLWDADQNWHIPAPLADTLDALAENMKTARAQKDWDTADALRAKLLDMGAGAQGDTWVPTPALSLT